VHTTYGRSLSDLIYKHVHLEVTEFGGESNIKIWDDMYERCEAQI
jgi:hypothetical protein